MSKYEEMETYKAEKKKHGMKHEMAEYGMLKKKVKSSVKKTKKGKSKWKEDQINQKKKVT